MAELLKWQRELGSKNWVLRRSPANVAHAKVIFADLSSGIEWHWKLIVLDGNYYRHRFCPCENGHGYKTAYDAMVPATCALTCYALHGTID